MSVDAVVVGGGHNGLVAALRLARVGMKVAVCEARGRMGGLAAREEFHPGYLSPGVLHDTSTWRAWLSRELDLEAHGWRPRARPPFTIAPDAGHALTVESGAAAAIEGADAAQVEAYRRWLEFLESVRPVLTRILDRPPPRLAGGGVRDLLGLALDGWAVRRLGRRTMMELLRVGPMPVADWLREIFELQPLMEGLMMPALIGTWLGPHSAGSSANLLAYECTAASETVGGPGGLVDALLSACESRDIELLRGTAVERIVVEDGSVKGVVCAGDHDIACSRVLTSCDPKRALLELLPPGTLPLKIRGQMENWRCRGTVAKVHLALSGPLVLAGREWEAARLGGGSIDALERAFDAVKYRQSSESLVLDARQPPVADGLAPGDGRVVSVLAGYAPYGVEGGWDGARREVLLDSVVSRIERVAPAVRELVVGSEVLTPVDLERRYGVSGGHVHHGEHALDQLLFVRPSHLLAHYEAPVQGLFLAGSGSHPGGGITGVPGWLAAGASLS